MTAAVLALACFMLARLRHTFRLDGFTAAPCTIDGTSL